MRRILYQQRAAYGRTPRTAAAENKATTARLTVATLYHCAKKEFQVLETQ